jgi:hypothetical protein
MFLFWKKITDLHVSCKACIQVSIELRIKLIRKKTAMAQMLRLNEREKELLRNKAVEINKVLINKKLEPVKDTELAHIVLEQG